jgi:hypothetical protein
MAGLGPSFTRTPTRPKHFLAIIRMACDRTPSARRIANPARRRGWPCLALFNIDESMIPSKANSAFENGFLA